MSGQTTVTKLRGPAHDARSQDNIALLVNPVVAAVNKTPIGGAAPPAWTPLGLANDFVNVAGNALAASSLDALKYAHLKLGVSSALGVGAGGIVTTLPAGQRPSETIRFCVRGTGATAQFLSIDNTGLVKVEVAVAAGGTVDAYISFLAEQ